MVGPRDIIANRLGGHPTQKHAAGMADGWKHRFGIVDCQLQMLRCEAVDERGRLLCDIIDHDDHTVIVPAFARRGGGGQRVNLDVDALRNLCAKRTKYLAILLIEKIMVLLISVRQFGAVVCRKNHVSRSLLDAFAKHVQQPYVDAKLK